MSATDGPSPATGGSTTGFGWSTGRRSSCVEPEPLELQEPLEPSEPRAAGLSHRALRAPPFHWFQRFRRSSGSGSRRSTGFEVRLGTHGTPETLEPEPLELQDPWNLWNRGRPDYHTAPCGRPRVPLVPEVPAFL